MTKTRGQFWVRLWHLKLVWFLETVLGSHCQLDVGLCEVDVFLHWNPCSWRRCKGGLKTGPSRRHRIRPAEGAVLDLRAKETCFKKSHGGSSFGPFLTPSSWQICWGLYFNLKLIWPATAAAGILNCRTGPPRKHRIQPVEGVVLVFCAKETNSKRIRKWTPLNWQWSLLESSFGHSSKSVELLFQVKLI